MKKLSKKITALLMALVIAVAIIPISGINLEADAATGNDVVAYARTFIGYPYVSGAKGPSAFDCSGFVYYVFNHFGIYIPNSTSDLWNNPSKYGTIVGNGSTANAQAGDLIVWYNHVSIYTSDGHCVEALNSRTGVTEYLPVNSHTNGMNYYVLRVTGLEDAKPVAPAAPVIGADKTTAGKGEAITISWQNVPGAESYRVLCKAGILTFVNSETTSTSKIIGLAAAGTYTVSVFAKNEAGETQSNEITLTIKSSSSVHTHKYSAKITTAATCEKAGVKTYTCSCGDSYTEPVPATGHTYGEWVTTKLATVSSAGEKQRTCTGCGKKETQTIPKLSSDALIIDKLAVTLKSNETAQLMANKDVKWVSSNPKVATVDANGKVTAVGTGTAVITAVAGSDTATCNVTVTSSAWWQTAIDAIMNAIQFIMNFIGNLLK